MKKILAIALVALVGFASHAATVSVTIAGSGVSNIISGSLSAQQFILTSAANNVGTIKIYDAPGTSLIYTNPANITVGAYATNYITSYTNYFGVQNNFTNVALVQYAITNAATTNVYPLLLSASAGTNSTVVYDGVNYFFSRGIAVTNAGAASATLSVTYLQ